MSCSIEMLRKIVFFVMSEPWEGRGWLLSLRPVARQESFELGVHRRLRSRFKVLQPEPFPKIDGGRQRHHRPRAALRRRLRARPPTPSVGTLPRMREKKTYSSRYVACSEAMFETGGAGVNWRNPSKTCRTLRGSAMPIGMGSDTFLKISGVFVASRHDPNCQNSQFSVRVIPSATCPRESVLPIWLGPDFSVVFEGYAGQAIHLPLCQVSLKRSLRTDILWTS